MENQPIQPDTAIDKTLAALSNATPPEGLEARILQRLQHHAPAAPFRWRDLFTGSPHASAWWRGALSGAVAASLLVGTLLLAQHSMRTRQPLVNQIAATPNLVPVAASTLNSPSHSNPCVTPSQLQTRRPVPIYHAESIPSASFAPSHPAPVLPLTAQERALARLVQTADPKLLASLDPEVRAKTAAQEIDDFNKFFTPPPAPPQPSDSPSPNNPQQPALQQGEQI